MFAHVTEADVIRWAGVVVAFVGAVVVAPSGVTRILAQVGQGLRRLRGWLARYLKFLRRNATVHLATAKLVVAADAGVGADTASVWDEGAAPEVKIERLRQEIGQLAEEVSKVRQEVQASHSALRATLDSLAAELRTAHHTLTDRLGQEARQDAQVDARGLVLIGFGVVLTGIPDGLAAVAWAGWVLVALATGLTFWLGVWPAGRAVLRALRSTAA